MDEALTKRIQFLNVNGIAEMGHSGRGLLDHLLGTHAILEKWGARQALSDAGLFHSVYGTESYKGTTIPLSMRESVREVIGEEAEEIAWLFGIMKRKVFRENFGRNDNFLVVHRMTDEPLSISREQFSDLVNLEIANGLEMAERLPKEERGRAAFLQTYRQFGSPEARGAVDEFFGEAG